METSVVEISKIPDEILSKIFSYLSPRNVLSNIVDVCYRWKLIVESDFTFWNNLQFVVLSDCFINASFLDARNNSLRKLSDEPNCEIVIGEKDLPKVCKMRSLKLKRDNKDTIPGLFAIRILDKISKICRNVEKFESLHCCGATSREFLKLLNDRYDKLKEISFGVTAVWKIPYDELSHFQKLSTIITHDYKFTRHDICQLADQCKQLNNLWILLSRYVRNDDIIYFLEKKIDTLHEIGLGSRINDLVLEKISDCKYLKVLFICDASFITGKSLGKITNLCNLRYVSLHGAKFPPQDVLQWIVTSTVPSQLKILDLTDYLYSTDLNIFKTIGKVCPVTTSNNMYSAISQLERNTKPKVHWMYHNVL